MSDLPVSATEKMNAGADIALVKARILEQLTNHAGITALFNGALLTALTINITLGVLVIFSFLQEKNNSVVSENIDSLLRNAGYAACIIPCALVVMSYVAGHFPCEGFGCMAVGLLWVFWGGQWGISIAIAIALKAAQKRRVTVTKGTIWATRLLLVIGSAHALIWIRHL